MVSAAEKARENRVRRRAKSAGLEISKVSRRESPSRWLLLGASRTIESPSGDRFWTLAELDPWLESYRSWALGVARVLEEIGPPEWMGRTALKEAFHVSMILRGPGARREVYDRALAEYRESGTPAAWQRLTEAADSIAAFWAGEDVSGGTGGA